MKPRIKYDSFLVRGQWLGFVIYPFLFFKNNKDEISDRLFRHELEHVYQVKRDGWFKFYLKYLWYQLRYGYKKNPYEIEARLIQNTPLTVKEKYFKETNRWQS